MNEKTINRINELYHKSQKEGLSEVEKLEQKTLRKEYIEAIRNNFKGTLDKVSFVNPDGSITKASDNKK
ncbi:MAG TPA: DUF896 domain-containing protein [Clostridiales bacterium]|nr:DUF896 domain-containing protein [Clostridiales bacterium]